MPCAKKGGVFFVEKREANLYIPEWPVITSNEQKDITVADVNGIHFATTSTTFEG